MTIACLSVFLSVGLGQKKPAFRSPVDGDIRLSGTFGELRSNHFHTGIDIKSRNGRGGDPILAVAEGYVSRIRLSAVGYGRALYIQHPNGYTTVYAHLDRFHPELEKKIRIYQEAWQTAHLDLYPLPEDWCVAAGDTIGFMGNSGSSAGPHLHFEVRHTLTEAPLNPLQWLFDYELGSRPFARQLKMVRLDEQGTVVEENSYRLKYQEGDFVPVIGALRLPEGIYGWSVQAIQPFNHGRNKNGLYSLESYVNGDLQYAVCMDSLPFHLNRYINAHIDYPMYCQAKQSLHSLFARPHQEASCLRFDKDRGTLRLSDSSTYEVRIRLSGIEGQSANVRFTLGVEDAEHSALPKEPAGQRVHPFEDFEYSDEYIAFHAKPYTFYSAHVLEISTVCENKDGHSLPTVTLDTDCHPFHTSAELRFLDLPSWEDSLRAKMYVGRWEDGHWVDVGGHWEDNDVVAKVREEGQYRICIAGSPPKLVGGGPAFRLGQQVSFRVQPNTPSQFRVKDIQIRVSYGGQFLPFSYDKKFQRLSLTIPREGRVEDRLHIELADRWGQSQSYSFPIIQ